MRLSALFEEFCEYLKVEMEAAPKTVTTYRSRFEDFLELARTELKQPTVLASHFTTDLCRKYQYALDRRGCQANTIRTRLATLSSFGKWAVQRGRFDRNPVDQIVRPKRKDRHPRVPRWSVVEDLVSNGLDLRAKAIIALLAWGGLRRAEVAALNVGDFDPVFGLRQVHGKGGHDEAVALPERACQIMAAYLETHRAGVQADAPMFVTRYLSQGGRAREGRMAEGRVYKLVRAIGAKAGLQGLHPHAFRHACGVQLLELANGDIRAVQEHLRHRDIQTTTIYTRLAKPKLKRVVNLFDKTGDSRPESGGRES
jgi:site-specific recombinase XerD